MVLSRQSRCRALSGERENGFGGFAKQPLFIGFGQEVDAVGDQRDGCFVGISVVELVGAVAGPHQTFGPEGVVEAFDHRDEVVVGRLLLAEGVVR